MFKNILIIKHGALGDLIQITGSLKSIRSKYPNSKITLLTDEKFIFFTKDIIFVNEVIYESRSSPLRIDLWILSLLKIIFKNYDLIIDLQNSDRTSVYYFFSKIFNFNLVWSGNRHGGKFKYRLSKENQLPIKDRIINQLKLMDIDSSDKPEIDWMIKNNIHDFPSNDFVIFLPGSSPKHKHKRWPAENFAKLAIILKEKNIDTVILGQSKSEGEEIKKIKSLSPSTIDCSDKDLSFIATMASKAIGAIANDTGPTFIVAAVGCPVTWLLSSHTNPKITQLVGSKVNTLKKEDISEISVVEVENNLALRH